MFEGYTYIKDKVKNKSFIVNFKTLIKEYSNLRLDITAPLIGHLASATVNGSQVQYMIPRQRKFYSGDVSGLNLGNKLPFPMDLKLLFNIFWAKKFNDSNWVCTDESSLKFNCFQRAENLTVRWSLHKNRQPKEIILIHPKGVVQFKVKSFASGLTQEQKNRFVMKKPNW